MKPVPVKVQSFVVAFGHIDATLYRQRRHLPFPNLIPVPFPTQLFLHPSLLPLVIHHSAHPQLPLFYTRFKTHLFHISIQVKIPPPRTAFTDFCRGVPFLVITRFLFLVFLIFRFCAVSYTKLAISSAFKRT